VLRSINSARSSRRRSHRYAAIGGMTEGASAMWRGKPCSCRQGVDADLLLNMRFDVFLNALQHAGRKDAAAPSWNCFRR
jgi:hypothetical protein